MESIDLSQLVSGFQSIGFSLSNTAEAIHWMTKGPDIEEESPKADVTSKDILHLIFVGVG